MAHLDEAQVLDAAEGRLENQLEGQLDATAAAHLAGCQLCGDRVGELRALIQSVAINEVPEPSPLFWDHFPARVSRAIDAAPRSDGWLGASRWLWGGAATAAIVVVLMLLPLGRDAGAPAPTGKIDTPPAIALSDTDAGRPESTEPESLDNSESLDNDEAWDIVRAVAEATDYEEVQDSGLTPPDGALERAALELTNDERAELARLIEEDSRGSSSREPNRKSRRTGASTP